MLSPERIIERTGKLAASRVKPLMTGDEAELLNLWREMVGDPAFVPVDLDDVWPVQLGVCTESLNLDWYTRRTGKPVTRRDEFVIHPEHDWAAATLDGWDDIIPAPIECKHVGGYEPTKTILHRYYPQAHWQMIVTGARKCVFSIIEAAREPILEVVEYDEAYAAELWERAAAFMVCVGTLTPPCALPPVAAPVKPERIYDMTGNNEWASNAVQWITNRSAAKDFEAAAKAIKALVPADAAGCGAHGINVTRAKNGALTIRERE
jgi:predicted phage-related endonuclease